ncbi:MAG: hypothetical protein EWV49_00685 [Microcystis aeruginosa Ma_QC_Ch_20071001_S25]|jgi:hypothetical protein|uniref:Uncharacterized protein n=3 Tax=Microcystis aeruginosa TaxID=1126 RepID=A0A552DA11_MICAE|nr:hypothetical protein [Microcystis aeruginosa L111-01]NCS05931.1 hypothetical protein [Microcystis aeruginosa G13-07]NCS38009.1 hypothetical protein [Microcystis aeruginosa BS13-10]NCS51102.1 hypothetical protein [Microcystis aeruginosa G13-05]TRT90410.1 MAG: hypothetical protein EWV82_00195 [Microcystis aeruginosa Ma_AC_P_19900807_S299]TRU19038.1 MAG: hypothetical protein EWV80_19930 [Microcystis aeruginosa Ma_QC_B_20070730_S2]TRU28448.1 MAG: hypothetical protein EWV81_05120 [Microcystis a
MLTPEKNYLQLEPPNYRKALDDFGVIELLHKLAALTGKDLGAGDLETLATLLIRQLTNLLGLDFLEAFLNAIRQGKGDHLSQCLDLARQLPLPSDSPSFFLDARPPRFPFGSRLRWLPLDDLVLTDWGIVIGRFYGYAPESGRWLWCYLLLLDPDSPSARWCTVDTAWECDLELLEDE